MANKEVQANKHEIDTEFLFRTDTRMLKMIN